PGLRAADVRRGASPGGVPRQRGAAVPAEGPRGGMSTHSADLEVCFLPATELAARLRRKELSAREVMAAHLRQIARVNPQGNAVVTPIGEQALERASAAAEELARGEALGPLHGLPVAHKDLQETKGVRTTYGSLIYRDNVPDFDSLVVERMRKAGAIALGK